MLKLAADNQIADLFIYLKVLSSLYADDDMCFCSKT